jgi:hypothetical protein
MRILCRRTRSPLVGFVAIEFVVGWKLDPYRSEPFERLFAPLVLADRQTLAAGVDNLELVTTPSAAPTAPPRSRPRPSTPAPAPQSSFARPIRDDQPRHALEFAPVLGDQRRAASARLRCDQIVERADRVPTRRGCPPPRGRRVHRTGQTRNHSTGRRPAECETAAPARFWRCRIRVRTSPPPARSTAFLPKAPRRASPQSPAGAG